MHKMFLPRLVRSLFIRTQTSPNPQFLKFFPGSQILETGTIDYPAPRHATECELAIKLFQIDGVTRVFLASDYIGVGKQEESEWAILKPQVFETIADYLATGKPIVNDAAEEEEDTKILDTDSEDVAIIKEILQFRIKPYVRDDGGDIRFVEFDETEGVVLLEMRGSCAGCPSSSATLKNGIEKMLMYYVASVKAVEAYDAE